VSVVLAVPLGVVAFFPLFGVLFTGNFDPLLVSLSLGGYLLGGVMIGYFNPSRWAVAGVLAWPCVLQSLYNLVLATADPAVQRAAPVAFIVLVVPLATALAGAYFGGLIARR